MAIKILIITLMILTPFILFCSLSDAQESACASVDAHLNDAIRANEYLKEKIKILSKNLDETISKLDRVSKMNIHEIPNSPTIVDSRNDETYIQALKVDLVNVHYNLGVMLQEDGKCDAAIREYNKVLELKPDDADSHLNLAIVYDKDKYDPSMAIAHYQKYLELNPHAPEAELIKQSVARLEGK